MIRRNFFKSALNIVGILLFFGFAREHASAGEVLYISNWSGMTTDDLVVKGMIEELGHTVVAVASPNADISQAQGKILIIVSQSAEYWEPTEGFKETTVPLLTSYTNVWSNIGMLASGGGYFSDGRTDLNIVEPNHPLAAGFSGNVAVCTSPCSMHFGYPTGEGQAIVKEPGSNHPAIFGYEKGSEMALGFRAPARRVGTFLCDNTASLLTPHGRTLIKNAIIWATSLTPPKFLQHPQSLTVHERQAAFFNTTANGIQPITFQWLKNGTPISGATTAYYTTPGSVLADNGAVFRCVVTNVGGHDTSVPAILTVVARGTPKSSELISVSGELTAADGTPLGTGTPVNKDITVKVFNAATGGNLVHTESFLTTDGKAVPVKNGRFLLRLGMGASATEIQDVVSAYSDLYVEFVVGTGSGAETLAPRIPLTSPAMVGAARVYRGMGAPTSPAQAGTLYQNLTDDAIWMRVAHNWVKISN
jgi:hypothetical protein